MASMLSPNMTKKEMLKQAIRELGPNVSFVAARDWVQRQYRTIVANKSYNDAKKDLVRERQQIRPAAPITAPPQPAPAVVATPVSNNNEGVATLVRTLKSIIAKHGKNELKQLIEEL